MDQINASSLINALVKQSLQHRLINCFSYLRLSSVQSKGPFTLAIRGEQTTGDSAAIVYTGDLKSQQLIASVNGP